MRKTTSIAAFAALSVLAAACSTPAEAPVEASITAPIMLVSAEGLGAPVGSITLTDSAQGGVALALDIHGLPPGDHGFHLHAGASCAPGPNAAGAMIAAGAASGHYDPAATGAHLGPLGQGHEGDLPLIHVAPDGTATQTLAAPHIPSIADARGHAIVIHAGGDNYSDMPAPLGGGGARIACGVIG
jgi:Cu-Zn family superoxide dismutase